MDPTLYTTAKDPSPLENKFLPDLNLIQNLAFLSGLIELGMCSSLLPRHTWNQWYCTVGLCGFLPLLYLDITADSIYS